MDVTAFVDVGESGCHAEKEFETLGGEEGVVAEYAFFEIGAVDVFAEVVVLALDDSVGEIVNDVGMVEMAECFTAAAESVDGGPVEAELGAQDAEYKMIAGHISGEVDYGHAAFREFFEEGVAGKCCSDSQQSGETVANTKWICNDSLCDEGSW